MPAPLAKCSAQPQAVALFASDVHLQESMPQTSNAFLRFLSEYAVHVPQLFLLGDLFEYWAGDDDLATPFHQQIIEALRRVSSAGTAVFWMPGNRDFLIGDVFCAASGVTKITDPHVVTIAEQPVVLAHGDAQCTDDEAYMAFRTQVRDSRWQQNFLSMPLAQRKAIIAQLREGSREAQRSKSYEIMDVNRDAIAAVFNATQTHVMIHGHTHRPDAHSYPDEQRMRYVLPDWDCDASKKRGGWITAYGDRSFKRYQVDGDEMK